MVFSRLELMFANMTNQLNPPHKYTPWITINGMVSYIQIVYSFVCSLHLISMQHNTNAENNGMVKEICSAYTGNNLPAACNKTV